MKKRIVVSIAGVLLATVSSLWVYKNLIRERNIFDQMYYTRIHNGFVRWISRDFKGRLGRMKQLEGTSIDLEETHIGAKHFSENYRPDYLEEGAYLEMDFYSSRGEIYFTYYTDWERAFDYLYCYIYKYNVRNKVLSYSSNDPNDEKKDFLFEIVLKDWFEVNTDTRFSLENLGKITVVEH